MLYKSNTTVEILESGAPLTEAFCDDLGNPADPTSGIFLICSINPDGEWEEPGTGFFIGPNGLFATAAHVLTDRYGVLLENLVAIQLLRNSEQAFAVARKFARITLHKTADVAVGILQSPIIDGNFVTVPSPPFVITSQIPTINDNVASFTIPAPAIINHVTGKREFSFAQRLIRGNIEDDMPDGRGFLRGHCYLTSIELKGGASGGPVAFGDDGRVFAVNSTGMSPTEGDPYSFLTSINEILDLEIENILTESGNKNMTIREMAEQEFVRIR